MVADWREGVQWPGKSQEYLGEKGEAGLAERKRKGMGGRYIINSELVRTRALCRGLFISGPETVDFAEI